MKKYLFAVALVAATLSASVAFAQNRSFATCRAYTACYNRFGMIAGNISCLVSGSSSQGIACTWAVDPYKSVSCSGFATDQWGNYGWVNLWDSCARFW